MKWIVFLTVVLLVYQIFTWVSFKAIHWLFQLKTANPHNQRRFAIAFWVLSELVIVFGLSRVWHHGLKIATTYLVLLFFISSLAILGKILLLMARLLLSTNKQQKFTAALRVVMPVGLLGLLAWGVYSAYSPQVVYYNITLDKPLNKPFRIALVSDTHIGLLLGHTQLQKLQQIVNDNQADILLMAGDIMDDNVIEYEKQNIATTFASLSAPLGVYAVMGNHDHMDSDNIAAAIQKTPVILLQDEVISIDNNFNLVGRLDDRYRERQSTSQLLKQINNTLPTILLEHEPTQIQSNANTNIDMQFSGHSHRGQIFPASIITKMMYYIDHGHAILNGKHFFVTSGFGFWGTPLRIGTRAEVMIIDVNGRQDTQ